MTRRIVTTILTFTIFIGIVGLALNRIWGEGTVSYLQTRYVGNMELYEMDVWNYIENIRTNVTDVSQLTLNLPSRQWNSDIINNLKCIADYLIFMANILVYPIRLGGYTMRLMFVVVGYNFTNPNYNIQWLVNLVNNIINAQIPYVS